METFLYSMNFINKLGRLIFHVQGLYKCSCFVLEAVINTTAIVSGEDPDDGQEL